MRGDVAPEHEIIIARRVDEGSPRPPTTEGVTGEHECAPCRPGTLRKRRRGGGLSAALLIVVRSASSPQLGVPGANLVDVKPEAHGRRIGRARLLEHE